MRSAAGNRGAGAVGAARSIAKAYGRTSPTTGDVRSPCGCDGKKDMQMGEVDGIRIVDQKTGGQKGQKLERYDLIPFEALDELARLYGVGATKYADDNWRKGYSWRLSLGAGLRHLSAFVRGHSYDTLNGKKDGPKTEGVHTGCHHVICMAWHCFTLFTFDTEKLGTDDRPIKKSVIMCPRCNNAEIVGFSRRTDNYPGRLCSITKHFSVCCSDVPEIKASATGLEIN